jgi:hypothetical protein
MNTLYNYKTGEEIREATLEEKDESFCAEKKDGGVGVIDVNGLSCYVLMS